MSKLQRRWLCSAVILVICSGFILYLGYLSTPMVSAQTIPTRTPTPGSGGGQTPVASNTPAPISTPAPTNTPVPVNTTVPTNTPIANETASATPAATAPATTAATATIAGVETATATAVLATATTGPVATATATTAGSGDPRCTSPIFAATFTDVNIRSGPETTFDVVGQITQGSELPIIGRAADTTWWYLFIDNQQRGWVFTEVGTVVGNGGGVPVVDAAGAPIAAGAWNPTPIPTCPTVESVSAAPTTAFVTATPIAAAENSAAPTATSTVAIEEATTNNDEAPSADIATATTTATPIPLDTGDDTETVEVIAADQGNTTSTTVSNRPETGQSGPNWLFASGIVLIVAGLGTYVLQRRRQ